MVELASRRGSLGSIPRTKSPHTREVQDPREKRRRAPNQGGDIVAVAIDRR